MAVKIMDTLEPAGEFPVANAEHILIENDITNESFNLKEFLLSTPQIDSEATVEVANEPNANGTYKVTVNFSARSRLSGGCTALLSWFNKTTNTRVSAINQAGINGQTAISTNLPIGLYSFTLAVSNQNGTVTATGETAIGSIIFKTPTFDTVFESRFFTAGTTDYLQLDGTVTTAYTTKRIDAIITAETIEGGVGKPVDVLARSDDKGYTNTITIELSNSVVKPGTTVTINSNEAYFVFKPEALNENAYSMQYRLSVKIVAVEENDTEHTSKAVVHETAVMRPNTIVLLSEGDPITESSNVQAAKVKIRLLTSSSAVAAAGTKVACQFYNGADGTLLGTTYPSATVTYGEVTEVYVTPPSTLTTSLSNIRVVINPRNVAGINYIVPISFDGVMFTYYESSNVVSTDNLVANFLFSEVEETRVSERIVEVDTSVAYGITAFKFVPSDQLSYSIGPASNKDESTVTYLDFPANSYASIYYTYNNLSNNNIEWTPLDPVSLFLGVTGNEGITIEMGFRTFENKAALTGHGIAVSSTKATTNFAAPLSADMIEGEWHHLAISYNSATATAENLQLCSSIYLDGVLVSGHKQGLTTLGGTDTPLLINAALSAAGLPTPSTAALGLQYLRIYKAAFTPETALQNYLASCTYRQAEQEAAKSQLTKVYFISEFEKTTGADYTDIPGEDYKGIPMRETSFAILNTITEKKPSSSTPLASKNTFVPCTIVAEYLQPDPDNQGQYQTVHEVWAKGKSGMFDDDNDETYPVSRAFLQGTSTLRYPIKNYQITLSSPKKPPSIPEDSIEWLADTVYTLKCDFMEQSHRNNTPTACFYQDKIVSAIENQQMGTANTSALSPASAVILTADNGTTYHKYRDAINGFPVEVYYLDPVDRSKLDSTNKDKYIAYVSGNTGAFEAVGSYMFNVDKEGKQLGFCLDDTDVRSMSDTDTFDLSKINLNTDSLNFIPIETSDGYRYSMKCAGLLELEKLAGIRNLATMSADDGSLHWKQNGYDYKLQVLSKYLPCVSYEGATNENAAAAAFVPYEQRWPRYLALCWEKGTVVPDTNTKTFYYRAIDEGKYRTTIDTQTGNEVFIENTTSISQPVTYEEFKKLVDSTVYDAYNAANPDVNAEYKIGQKLALVLSKPEYEDQQGDDEIGYLEATLDPRFSFTDDIEITLTGSDGANTTTFDDVDAELGDDVSDAIENHFKFSAIKQAIDWVYARYEKIFSQDSKVSAEGIAEFKQDFGKYFSLEYCIAYYLQMMVFAQVDNAGKNAMYDTWGDGKLYPRPYDMDTQLGLNNRGQDNVLTYAEMSMETSPIAKANQNTAVSNWSETAQRYAGDRFSFYNTSESALWKSFYKAFTSEICSTYFSHRKAGGMYDIDTIMSLTDGLTSDKIAKNTYNLDAQNKFFDTSSQNNLHCIAGSRRDRCYNYLIERLSFLDTLFYAYSTGSDNSISTIITPSVDSYFAFAAKYPQYVYINLDTKRHVSVLLRPEDTYEDANGNTVEGVRVSFTTTDASNGQNKNTDIYCCKYLTRLDGLTSFASVSKLDMTNLQNIVELDLSNTEIRELSLSPSLTKINISQSSTNSSRGYSGQLDLSKCSNLQEVIATNAVGLTGIKLPKNAPLHKLSLANTSITSLELIDLPQLTTDNIDISGCEKLTKIQIVNCPWVYSVPELPFTMPKSVTDCTITNSERFIYLNLESRRLSSLVVDGSLHTLRLTSSTLSCTELDLAACTRLTSLLADSVYITDAGGCTLHLPAMECYENSDKPKVYKLEYTLAKSEGSNYFDTLTELNTEVSVENNWDNWSEIPEDYSKSDTRLTYTKHFATGIFKTFKINGSGFNTVYTGSAEPTAGCYDFSNVPLGRFRSTGVSYDISNTPVETIRNLTIYRKISSLFINCKSLVTIDGKTCKLYPKAESDGTYSMSSMFQNCYSLETVSPDIVVANQDKIKIANYMFWNCQKIAFNTVCVFINEFPNIEKFDQGLRGAMLDCYNIDLDALFGYEPDSKTRIHKKLQTLSLLFYDKSINKLTGKLPPAVTDISAMCAYTGVKFVSRDIFEECTGLLIASNAFYDCRFGNPYYENGNVCTVDRTENSECLLWGNNTEHPVFKNHKSLYSIKGLFANVSCTTLNTGEKLKLPLKTLLGECPGVIYADALFKGCNFVDIESTEDTNGSRLFDAIPNVYFADSLLQGTPMSKFPHVLGKAEKLISARGMLAAITFSDESANITLAENWLSASMPTVKFIGTTGNIAESVDNTINAYMFKSYGTEAALAALPDGYTPASAHQLGLNDSWQDVVTPAILGGSKPSSGIIRIPISILSELSSLIDCSAAFAAFPLASGNLSLESTNTLDRIFIGGSQTSTPIFPESVQSCAYCFAGVQCGLVELPPVFDSQSSKVSALKNAAGVFYKMPFTNEDMSISTILEDLLGKPATDSAPAAFIQYPELCSIENLFSGATFVNDTQFDITGYRLQMKKLATTAGAFRGLANITGEVSNLFFDCCRDTLISAKHVFNGSGITGIGTGSYTCTEKTKYASLAKVDSNWSFSDTTSYMRTWWQNHSRVLPEGLVGHLKVKDNSLEISDLAGNVKVLIISADPGDGVTNRRNAAYDGYANGVWTPISNTLTDGEGNSFTEEILAIGFYPKNLPLSEGSEQVTTTPWFKAVYVDTANVTYWFPAATSEVELFLNANGCFEWFNFENSTNGLLIASDAIEGAEREFTTKIIVESDICDTLHDVMQTEANTPLEQTLYTDLILSEGYNSYETHLKNNLACTAVEKGIFSNCAKLLDISFCFANCGSLEGAIPHDCVTGSRSLQNMSAMFAFDIKMCSASCDPQVLRVNNTKLELSSTGAGVAQVIYPKVRPIYNDALVATGEYCLLEAVPTSIAQGDGEFGAGYLVPEDFVGGLSNLQDISGLFLATGLQDFQVAERDRGTSGSEAAARWNIAKLMFSDKTFSTLPKLKSVKQTFMMLQPLYAMRLGETTDLFNASISTIEDMYYTFGGMSVASLKFLKPGATYSKLTKIAYATLHLNRFRYEASSGSLNDGWNIGEFSTVSELLSQVAMFSNGNRFPRLPISTSNENNIERSLAGFFSVDNTGIWYDSASSNVIPALNEHGILHCMCSTEFPYSPLWTRWVEPDWTPDISLADLDTNYKPTKLIVTNIK